MQRFSTLSELLAATPGSAIALRAPERPATDYDGLRRQVHDTVAALNALGVRRGDRVAIVLPNGPEMAAGFVAVASGATACPLNPAYRADEFEFYLNDLDARALIVEAGSSSAAVAVAERLGVAVIELHAGAAAGRFTLAPRGGAASAAPGGAITT